MARYSVEIPEVDDPAAFAAVVAQVLEVALDRDVTVRWVIRSTR